jgi:magnesium transporter
VAEWTEEIEEAMFASRRQPARATEAIFSLKKDLLQLRKSIPPSREVVNVVLRRDHALFGEELVPYFQDVYDHSVRVIDSLDTYRDLLASALDTHLSIVSNDVSQTVKKMTAVTAILMVDALVAGIYGMNFDRMPELHWEYGYPFALALIAVAVFRAVACFQADRAVVSAFCRLVLVSALAYGPGALPCKAACPMDLRSPSTPGSELAAVSAVSQ